MSQVKTIQLNFFQLVRLKLKDYAELTKIRLALLVVFSAVIGYLFGIPTHPSLIAVFWLAIGGMLVTGASNAINEVIEKDIDKLMSRTENRPLPAERMNVLEAILVAGFMGIGGLLILTYFFNPIAGVLAAISLLSYAFVYTPLKRISSVAVFVGAIPGALPPMIGYVCAVGTIDFVALTIFFIQFLWQFPHFWAIAWIRYEDYLKAGIMMLPSVSGKTRASAIQNVFYTAALLIVSMIPYFFNWVGIKGAAIIAVAGVLFMWQAVMLYRKCDDASAKGLMFGSFAYLPVVQLAMLLDKL